MSAKFLAHVFKRLYGIYAFYYTIICGQKCINLLLVLIILGIWLSASKFFRHAGIQVF